MSASNDQRIQLIDSIETYVYGTNEEIIHRKEEIKCTNAIKQYEEWLTITKLQKKA